MEWLGDKQRRALVLAAPWPFVPTVLGGFRGPQGASARRRLGYLCAYCGAVGLCGAIAPLSLIPIGAAAASATVAAAWYTRSSYGRGRGLPPGRLSLASLGPLTDHSFWAKGAARYGPIFKARNPLFPAPTVAVVGLPRGLAVLAANEDQLGSIGIPFDPLIPKLLLRHMGPDDHPPYRKLFQDAFSDEAIVESAPELNTIVAAGLRKLAEADHANGVKGIAPRAALEQIVLTSFVRLFLGLPPDSPDAAAVIRQYDAMGHHVNVGDSIDSPLGKSVKRAAEAIESVVQEQAARRTGGPGEAEDHPPRSFLAALLRKHPRALDDPTVAMNLVFLLRTSATDVTGLLHWVVAFLAANPVLVDRLREDEDGVVSRRVVMETLRLEQSELIYRTVMEPIEIDGLRVPAGWVLRLCIRESHQDANVFDHPERFDPDRFERRYNRHEYSPLGLLGRSCLGVGTIYAIAPMLVAQLARNYDLEVRSTGPPEFVVGWRPSPNLRISLRQRTPSAGAVTTANG